jgi:hypothetical protein
VVEKIANGKESLKITIKSPTLGGGGGQAQAKIAEELVKQPEAPQPVRLIHATSQTGSAAGCPVPPVRPAFESLNIRELSSQRVQRRGDESQTREALSVGNSGPSQPSISY